MSKSKKKYKKNNNKNIFKNRKKEDYRFTYHFLDRWNERIKSPKFEYKDDLEKYIKKNYGPNNIKKISGDYYLMGDIIVTCTEDSTDDTLLFVTIYGKVEDNYILYNILTTEGANSVTKIQKKYGKINLSKY